MNHALSNFKLLPTYIKSKLYLWVCLCEGDSVDRVVVWKKKMENCFIYLSYNSLLSSFSTTVMHVKPVGFRYTGSFLTCVDWWSTVWCFTAILAKMEVNELFFFNMWEMSTSDYNPSCFTSGCKLCQMKMGGHCSVMPIGPHHLQKPKLSKSSHYFIPESEAVESDYTSRVAGHQPFEKNTFPLIQLIRGFSLRAMWQMTLNNMSVAS